MSKTVWRKAPAPEDVSARVYSFDATLTMLFARACLQGLSVSALVSSARVAVGFALVAYLNTHVSAYVFGRPTEPISQYAAR